MNSAYFSYTRVIAVVALVAGIFLLWPGKLFFLNDDFTHLYLTSKGQWLQHNSFRPVCDLSMWIDYKLYGLNAIGFHFTNVLLHILATYFVYRFTFQLLTKYHQAGVAGSNAILIAAIFFVYCFHGETLYWVIGRSASLGTIFFLLSLTCYLKREQGRSFILSLVFFLIALLTYESVWIIPFAFLVISWMDVRSHLSVWKKEVKFLTISIILFVSIFILRSFYIDQFIGEYEGGKFLSLDIGGLSWNWLKLILRSFSRQSGVFVFLAIMLLVCVTSLISFFFTRKKVFVAGLLALWLSSYLPYLSLGIDTFGSEGERYLYLPSVFLSIIIGVGIINASRGFKYTISLLFFFINIFLLYKFRDDYEVASAVTSATADQFKQANDQTIYINQLPQENNGVLIFRSGIEDAHKLFTANKSSNLIIISTYPGNYMYFTGINELERTDDLPGKGGKNAVFDFSNNALAIYR
jgi:hypothetical protein